jgi:hypothetical protein
METKLFKSEKIDGLHKKLNSKKHSPRHGYRRNAAVYRLVCYVNNIVGCYMSHNESPIPVFIGRARKYMKDFMNNEDLIDYYKMVNNYLDTVENHLKDHGVDTTSIYNYRDKDKI